MICILGRSLFICVLPNLKISVPSNHTWPAVGSNKRIDMRPTVVLPHPDSPTSPRVSPLSMCRETFSTALTCPTTLDKSPPKTGKYFFDSDNDYLESINESIRSIRAIYPSILIVLKPKSFRTINANDWILEYIESLNDEQIIVDCTPLTFTAHKAILAIFNIASTAYFDFVVHDVPCIEHSHYGKTYYRINPNGSYMKSYGAVITSTENELVEAINMVKSQSFPVFGKSNLENMIGHENTTVEFQNL